MGAHRPKTAAGARRRQDIVAASQRRLLSRLNALEIPPVKHPRRRQRCSRDLRRFCETYGRPAFSLPFSDDHLKAIAKLQEAILVGGRFALAMPRGSGKTTLCIWALLWAMCYGHRRYIVLIACDMDAAQQLLGAVKAQVETNHLLYEDFPDLCAAPRLIQGVAQRASRIHIDGEFVGLVWSTRRIVAAAVPGAPCSGVKVEAYGLDSRLRGAFVQRQDGTIERPDFALLDDPQKEVHARSQREADRRERAIKGTVLGLAGPGRRIAAVCPCTVIERDDLADRLLDPQRNPEWQSLRTRMVYRWPDAQDTLWAEYAQRRREAQVGGDPLAHPATEFYREHREEMDKGAIIGWPARKHEHELSALQHAENLLLDVGETAFAAEYQNDPQSQHVAPYVLTRDAILSALNGLPPRVCPQRTISIVGFIDINRYAIHWAVAATRVDRALFVLDYGRYPPRGTLYKGDGSEVESEEQVIRRALDAVGEAIIVGREYIEEGTRARRRFDLLLVDCGYLDKVVYDFAQFARLPTTILPSRGFGSRTYRPSSAKGRVGDHWHISESPGKGRFLAHDADYWRATAQKAWLLSPASPGSISLFGNEPTRHAEFAEQASRERLIGIVQKATHDEYIWDEQGHAWHDLGDCVTGLHVAASFQGADPIGAGARWRAKAFPRPVRKPRVPIGD